MSDRHQNGYEQELRSFSTANTLVNTTLLTPSSDPVENDSAASREQVDIVGSQKSDVSHPWAHVRQKVQSGSDAITAVSLSPEVGVEPLTTNGDERESKDVHTNGQVVVFTPDLISKVVPDNKDLHYKNDSEVEDDFVKISSHRSGRSGSEKGTTVKHMASNRNFQPAPSADNPGGQKGSEISANTRPLTAGLSEAPSTTDHRLWDRIKHLRADVWSMRSRLHEIRQRLRHKQALRSAADDELLKYVRRMRLEASLVPATLAEPLNILDQLSEACESTKVECGLVEDELETVENDLGVKEFALQKLEVKIYEKDANLRKVEHETGDVAGSISSDESASVISHNFHPVVSEYLSKLGDVDISRERLDWHLDEKDNLDEEKARRERVGLKLADSDQAWLDEFEAVRLEIQTQLDIELKEAEELQHKAFSMGLLDPDGEPVSFEEQERRNFDSDFEKVEAASGYVEFSTLLPPPSGLQIGLLNSPLPEHSIQGEESISPRLRVDQWLLHQLRMSTVQIRLLAEEFKAEAHGIAEPQQWQDDVLGRWFSDNAGAWKSAPLTATSEKSSTSTESAGSPYSRKTVTRLAVIAQPTPVIAPAQQEISELVETTELCTTSFSPSFSLSNSRGAVARSV